MNTSHSRTNSLSKTKETPSIQSCSRPQSFSDKVSREALSRLKENPSLLNEKRQDDRPISHKKVNSQIYSIDKLNQENSFLYAQNYENKTKGLDSHRKSKNSSKNHSHIEKTLAYELKYEKEESSRLKFLLKQIESERTELLSRIKDHEIAASSICYEKIELAKTVDDKNEQVSMMESEIKQLISKCTEQNNKLLKLETEVKNAQNEKKKVLEALMKVENDKTGVVEGLNIEKAKNNEFQALKYSEIDNLLFVHKKHSRVLASRSICLELDKHRLKVESQVFKMVKKFGELLIARKVKVKNLALMTEKYFWRKQKYFLDIWKGQLNWLQVHKNRLNVIDLLNSRGQKSKIFSAWRELFSYLQHSRQLKSLSCKKVFKLLVENIGTAVYNRFFHWKNFASSRKNARTRIGLLAYRKMTEKICFELKTWLFKAKKIANLQHREDLAVEISALLTKFRFFCAFKEHVRDKKHNREFEDFKEKQADNWYKKHVISDFIRVSRQKVQKRYAVKRLSHRVYIKDIKKALGSWKKTIEIDKRDSAVDRYLQRKNAQTDFFVQEKLFYIWKEHFLGNKLKKTQNELEIEKPKRIQLEEDLKATTLEASRSSLITSIRKLSSHLKAKFSCSFYQWKNITQNFSSSLPKIKRLLLKHYTKKLSSAFVYMKKRVDDMNFINKNNEAYEYKKQNIILAEHMSNLEFALNIANERNIGLTKVIMQKVLFKIKDFRVLSYLRNWAKNAFEGSNKAFGTYKIHDFVTKKVVKRSFYAIFSQAEKMKRRSDREKKVRRIHSKTRECLLFCTFAAWGRYKRNMMSFRKKFLKFAKRNDMVQKQFGVNSWKNLVGNMKKSENLAIIEDITKENQGLQKNIELLTYDLNSTKKTCLSYEKSLAKASKLRLINSLTRHFWTGLNKYWQKWVQNHHTRNSKLRHIKKVIGQKEKNNAKRSWKTWITYIKNKKVHEDSQEITKHIKTIKAANRATKELKLKLEDDISNRDNTIILLNKSLEKQEKVKEFLLTRSVYQYETEYSESRASFAFKAMKNRYFAIKNTLTSFVKKLKLIQKRSALSLIFEDVRQQIYINSLSNTLIGTFKKFNRRYLRNLFDRWGRNIQAICINVLEGKVHKSSQQISLLQSQKAIAKNNYQENLINLLVKSEKKRLWHAWNQTIKRTKACKKAAITYKKWSKEKKCTAAVKLWAETTKNKARAKGKTNKSILIWKKNTIKKIFKHWKCQYSQIKLLCSNISKLFNNSHYSNTLFALDKLKSFASYIKSTNSWVSKSKSLYLIRFLKKSYNQMLSFSYDKWKIFNNYKSSGQQTLKRVFLRCLHRKQNLYFGLWKLSLTLESYIIKNNTQGPVAIENLMLKQRSEILTKLIQDEGIDGKYVENYILERESLQASLKRKGLNHIRYRAGLINTKDNCLLPKYLLTWKLWTLKRKRFKKYAGRVLAYRQKPDLLQAFSTWKKGLPLIINAVKKYTRQNLYGLIAKMDHDIKTLETKVETLNSESAYLQAYSSILEQHTRRGQNLALILTRNNIQKTFYRSFLRWIVHCNLMKILELTSQINEREEMVYDNQVEIQALQVENDALVIENSDLRQASLDGVAIAEAFETLSKERERLSSDLAERTATIKRLLEHNNQLANRLKQLGEEEKSVYAEIPRFKRYN